MYRDDQTLLNRWHTRRDAEAFDALVTRYAGMVFAVCKRILRNASDAEEVAQECFLVLANRSDRVDSSLGGWLHRTATHTALNRLKQDQRRQRREHAFAETQRPTDAKPWSEIQSHVDEAMAELPEPIRELVVAHFLCRMTHEEIAAEHGIPRRTVSHRIQRGVEQIRSRLRARGISVGAAGLVSGLTANSAQAIPPALIAGLGRIGIAGVAPSHATASVLGGLFVMKTKLVTFAGCAMALAAIGLWSQWPSWQSPQPSTPPPDTNIPVNETEPLDVSEGQVPAFAPTTTDAGNRDEQTAVHHIPSPGWIADPADSITIAGFVTDGNGVGLSGARVEAMASGFGGVQDLADNINELYSARTDPEHLHIGRTDRDGRFEIADIRHAGLIFVGASMEGYTMNAAETLPLRLDPGSSKDDVFITLHRGGFVFHGRVIEEKSRRPVSDARILAMPSFLTVAQADSQGRFSMTFEKADLTALHVVSDTCGRVTFSDVFTGAAEPVTLEMPANARLSGEITEGGMPSPGVQVRLNGTWNTREHVDGNRVRGRRSGIGFSYEAVTDRDGSFWIDGIDPGQEYTITLSSADGTPIVPLELLGSLEPGSETVWNHELNQVTIIHGTVYGTDSRQPLQDVYVNVLKDGLPIGEAATRVKPDGSYRMYLPEAEGEYRIYPAFLFSKGVDWADAYGKTVQLKPGESAKVNLELLDPWSIRARIVNQDGDPVPVDSIVINVPNQASEVLRANDADGVVIWSGVEPLTETWIAVSALGYTGAMASVDGFEGAPGAVYDAGDLVLYKTTAGVQGIVTNAAGDPMPDAAFRLGVHYGPEESILYFDEQTDHLGNFIVMDGIPVAPSYFTVKLRIDGKRMAGSTEYFVIESGSITHVGQIVVE